jgi:hypothetical protein
MPAENNDLTPFQQSELDKVTWKINFQKKVMEDLKSNENIQNYFKGFTPDSVKNFIESYSIQKSNWHHAGALWIKVKEDHDLKWTEAAWWHLELIQQKKLFDIQCLWRAEKIQLPLIELSCDFHFWEKNILNCPFVDPITQDEVDLYQQYLKTENVQLEDDVEIFLSFQNYSLIKDAYSNEDSDYNFPEWYEFYNSRRGTSALLELPDTRGNKERFYLDLARSPERKQAIAEISSVFHQNPGEYTDKQGRKILNAFSPESLDLFVEAFEDKQTREFYKAYAWAHRDHEELEQLQEDIKLLLSAPEPIPVEEHNDWKEAIQNAVRKYSIQLISEHLTEAFGQYQMNRSMNIAFPEKEAEHVKAAKKVLVDDILLGRKLNGEPEDLNF